MLFEIFAARRPACGGRCAAAPSNACIWKNRGPCGRADEPGCGAAISSRRCRSQARRRMTLLLMSSASDSVSSRDRQHEVGDAGGDRAARHRGIFGLVGILHQDDAAGFLHRLTPSAPSEPAPLRTMAKPSPSCSATERKNRSIGARCPRGSSNGNVAISRSTDLKPAIRGNDIDAIGFQLGADRSTCSTGMSRACADDLRKSALALRIEMDNDDERRAGAAGSDSKNFCSAQRRRPRRRSRRAESSRGSEHRRYQRIRSAKDPARPWSLARTFSIMRGNPHRQMSLWKEFGAGFTFA